MKCDEKNASCVVHMYVVPVCGNNCDENSIEGLCTLYAYVGTSCVRIFVCVRRSTSLRQQDVVEEVRGGLLSIVNGHFNFYRLDGS